MINSIILTGRLTDNVEVKFTQNNKKIANFNIAVNRRFPQPNQPQADFINCIAFGKVAEILESHTKKGSLIGVEGTLQINIYEKDNVKHRNAQVLVSQITFLSRSENQQSSNIQSSVPNQTQDMVNVNYQEESYNTQEIEENLTVDSDDLPF